jgi:predicted kinase
VCRQARRTKRATLGGSAILRHVLRRGQEFESDMPRSPSDAADELRPFLLQMAGKSGAGKSTVASGLARQTGAVILDVDVLKLTALEVGLAWHDAGKIGYEGSWALAESLLGQGISVILDSPCRFERIVSEGMAIAARQGAVYAFVECVLPDIDELRHRLRTRTRLRSQVVDVDIPPPDAAPAATPTPSPAAPSGSGRDEGVRRKANPPVEWIRLDTRKGVDECVALAADYLRSVLADAAPQRR